MRRLKFLILVVGIFTIYHLPFTIYASSQDSGKLTTLTKQIMEAKTNEDAYPALEDLTDLYFKDSKYNEFVEFLHSLAGQKKTLEPAANYYIAITRYYQLRHLEETQDWNEYFNQGNNYRDQILKSLESSIDTLGAGDVLNIYARLILWKFHKDLQDSLSEGALSDLMNAVFTYAKDAKNILPIKDAAAELLSYAEKTKSRELSKLYVDKVVTSDVGDDELANIALGFYKEGNLELAEAIYDVYIERTGKSLAKEKLMPVLIDIARMFSYKDEGLKDEIYAEKIFNKIQALGTKAAFSEELLYLRAFNLEKAKEYLKAKDSYVDLLERYPGSIHADEANFKLGIIYTYILRDIKNSRAYFEGLAQEIIATPATISSLYQLGLLSQWEGDLVNAKKYYNNLLEEAKDGFQENIGLTKERLKELEETKPMEYNLKTFLDVSLKEGYAAFDATKLDLRALPYKAKKEQGVNISLTAPAPESGCMEVKLQYLWSGNIGTTKPTIEQSSFISRYTDSGTKVINLVVVSASGIIERSFDIVDVD